MSRSLFAKSRAGRWEGSRIPALVQSQGKDGNHSWVGARSAFSLWAVAEVCEKS